MKYIVMLTCQFDEILGGAEKQCKLLSERLVEHDKNIIILTSRLNFKLYYQEKRDSGIKVIRFWTYAPPNLAGRFIPASFIWGGQAFLWILKNRKKIDLLHVHQLRINAYVAALASKLASIPSIMKLGLGGEKSDVFTIGQKKYLFGKKGRNFVLTNANIFIATTRTIYENLRGFGVENDRIKLIPNGVDLSRVNETDINRTTKVENLRRFIYLGRIAEEKKLEVIIEAFSVLRSVNPVCLHVVGEGEYELACRELVKKLGLESVVFFEGVILDPFPMLYESDFFIQASDREGLSNSLLEAMACGVVPVVSNVSGSSDILEDGLTGVLINGNEINDVASAIKTCADMPIERVQKIAKKASEMVVSNFDIDSVAKQYLDLYRTVKSNS